MRGGRASPRAAQLLDKCTVFPTTFPPGYPSISPISWQCLVYEEK